MDWKAMKYGDINIGLIAAAGIAGSIAVASYMGGLSPVWWAPSGVVALGLLAPLARRGPRRNVEKSRRAGG